MELWNLAIIFTLAFLGLVAVIGLIVFVFLAYRGEIAFTFKAYPGGKTLLETVKDAKAEKHGSVP